MNRQALFNILDSGKFIKEIGFKIEGAAVLDVCCGSGAVAFEALSRGAKSATLIDSSRIHLELAKKNSEILKVENEIEILCLDAKKLPKNSKDFDLIFIDPPYAEDYSEIIKSLIEKEWIKKSSLIVIEFQTTKEPSFENLKLRDFRKYGKSSFAFLQLAD